MHRLAHAKIAFWILPLSGALWLLASVLDQRPWNHATPRPIGDKYSPDAAQYDPPGTLQLVSHDAPLAWHLEPRPAPTMSDAEDVSSGISLQHPREPETPSAAQLRDESTSDAGPDGQVESPPGPRDELSGECQLEAPRSQSYALKRLPPVDRIDRFDAPQNNDPRVGRSPRPSTAELPLPDPIDHDFQLPLSTDGPKWEPKPAALEPALKPSRTDDPSRAMQIVAQRAAEIVDYGSSLANRNATYAARAEFIAALRSIAEALDAQEGGRTHSQSLDDGLQALREADEFVARQPDVSVDVARIVQTHKTPVLKEAAASDLSSLIARQRYYTYAQAKLVEACRGNSVASRAMYGLGKLHSVHAPERQHTLSLNAPKAVVFYRAAMMVDPQNYLAANELAVVLAKYGELETAREVLRHGLQVAPLPEAWHNLSVVHQRLGEHELARRARYEWLLASQHRDQREQALSADHRPSIKWVDPSEFARMHPPPGTRTTAVTPMASSPQPPALKDKQAGYRWWLPWK